PYTGSPIGWPRLRALEWSADAIDSLNGAPAKFAIYEHKFAQAIHRIFQSFAPYVRVRTPFTSYALFELFSSLTRAAKSDLYVDWLVRKYPAYYRWIPDQ